MISGRYPVDTASSWDPWDPWNGGTTSYYRISYNEPMRRGSAVTSFVRPFPKPRHTSRHRNPPVLLADAALKSSLCDDAGVPAPSLLRWIRRTIGASRRLGTMRGLR